MSSSFPPVRLNGPPVGSNRLELRPERPRSVSPARLYIAELDRREMQNRIVAALRAAGHTEAADVAAAIPVKP